MVPQVILNLKWSSNEECIPHLQELKWPMLSHRGRCHINWYQDQRSYVWYLKKPCTRYKWYKLQVVSTSGVIPTIKWCPSKMQDSSVNRLPQCNPLYQKRHTFLWKLMTKGERLKQRYEMHHGEKKKLGMGNGQRGSNIDELRRIKILGQEKHTSRGSKLMNFDWLHLIYA